jgi:hypothetical protein
VRPVVRRTRAAIYCAVSSTHGHKLAIHDPPTGWIWQARTRERCSGGGILLRWWWPASGQNIPTSTPGWGPRGGGDPPLQRPTRLPHTHHTPMMSPNNEPDRYNHAGLCVVDTNRLERVVVVVVVVKPLDRVAAAAVCHAWMVDSRAPSSSSSRWAVVSSSSCARNWTTTATIITTGITTTHSTFMALSRGAPNAAAAGPGPIRRRHCRLARCGHHTHCALRTTHTHTHTHTVV